MTLQMTSYKNILVSFVEVVVFLFSAYGGFLKKIAPPEQTNVSYSIGILSFLVLIVLLIISAVARNSAGRKYRGRWIVAGVIFFALAIPAAFYYPKVLDKYTYRHPLERPTETHVKGSDADLTDDAKEWLKANPAIPCPASCLERKLPPGDVWTSTSLQHANTMLLLHYAWLVLSLATAIFCLMEANIG